jgi:hypothetical protein
LSTSRTTVLHDGGAFTRWDKLQFLAGSDGILDELRVCSRKTSDANCGDCEKCYRNMIILDVLGVLERCKAFPHRVIDLDKVSRILIQPGWHETFYRNLRRFALSRKRTDVARAITRSFRRSRWRLRGANVARRIGSKRLVWRLGRQLRRWSMAGALR